MPAWPLGPTVVGCDIDARKIAALARGALPIPDPGLHALVAVHRASGRLAFTARPGRARGA